MKTMGVFCNLRELMSAELLLHILFHLLLLLFLPQFLLIHCWTQAFPILLHSDPFYGFCQILPAICLMVCLCSFISSRAPLYDLVCQSIIFCFATCLAHYATLSSAIVPITSVACSPLEFFIAVLVSLSYTNNYSLHCPSTSPLVCWQFSVVELFVNHICFYYYFMLVCVTNFFKILTQCYRLFTETNQVMFSLFYQG